MSPTSARMQSFVRLFLLCLSLLHSAPSTAETVCRPSSLDGYTPPKPIKRAPPIYPRNEAQDSNGGIVELEFMVDENGDGFEPIVTYSSHPGFENSAKAAVKKNKYQAAKLNGLPVSARSSLRIMYEMREKKDAVSLKFSRLYRKASAELNSENPNPEKTQELINRLQKSYALSPYANARLNFLRLQHAMLFGSTEDKILAAQAVLSFEKGVAKEHRAIDARQKANFEKSLFGWHANTQRYNKALRQYHSLMSDNQLTQKEINGLTSIANKICVIRDNNEIVVKTDIKISKRGFALEELFKQTFSLGNIEGELSGIKLRCQNKFKKLAFASGSEYRIPKSWGACDIQIIGESDTKAALYQY